MAKLRDIRLYVQEKLVQHATLFLSKEQSHYVSHVMRVASRDSIKIFNGQDGEWRAEITDIQKNSVALIAQELLREQHRVPHISLLFAPVKYAKAEDLTLKATELGIRHIQPVQTERTIVTRVNLERMQARAIEAAEQCERLDIPSISDLAPLKDALAKLDDKTALLHCDETGNGKSWLELIGTLKHYKKFAVLIGPEGGFSEKERKLISKHNSSYGISLGPRILKADTAIIAALTLAQATAGDWDEQPRFNM